MTCPKCQVQFLVDLSELGASTMPKIDAATATMPVAPPATGPGGTLMAENDASTLPEGMRFTLTVLAGPDEGKKLTLIKTLTVIGRQNADLVVADARTSSAHAAVEIRGRDFFLRDLGSSNGTFVNEEPVTETRLEKIQEFRAGSNTFLFTATEAD